MSWSRCCGVLQRAYIRASFVVGSSVCAPKVMALFIPRAITFGVHGGDSWGLRGCHHLMHGVCGDDPVPSPCTLHLDLLPTCLPVRLRTTARGSGLCCVGRLPCALLRSRDMATESEVLLRAAAAIAAYETGAAGKEQEQQDDVGVIHLTIRNNDNGQARSFLVDLLMGNVALVGGRDGGGEGERAVAAAVSRARLHLIYASEDVFLELARK